MATNLPPDGFRSLGLPAFPGAPEKRSSSLPASPSVFNVMLSAPLRLSSVSAGSRFHRHLLWPAPSSPDSVNVVTNTVSPSGRVRPLQDQPVSTASLLSLPPTATHCWPHGAARTGHTVTSGDCTPCSGVRKGRGALAFIISLMAQACSICSIFTEGSSYARGLSVRSFPYQCISAFRLTLSDVDYVSQLTEAAKGGWMKSKDTAAPAGGSKPSVDTCFSHQPAGSWPPLGQTDTGSPGGPWRLG